MNDKDKDLIELAAIAVKLPECGWMGDSFMYVKDNTFTDWNPLESDGDALRLAVDLEFEVSVMPTFTAETIVTNFDGHYVNVCVPAIGPLDRYAATRRAIVRAAAEIGSKL